jgi:predicted transport protein
MANAERSIVNELINFRGLVYAPLDKSGVMLLFGKVAEDLNMYVEELRPEAPDAILRRFMGTGWERLRGDFAYRSSELRQLEQESDSLDLIVCWEHDWADCPLEVVELRDRIREMENWPIHRPDEATDGWETIDLDEWFAGHRVPERTRVLFQALADHVRSIDEMCFYRVGRDVISFHSPQRTFVRVYPREKSLRIVLFTRGESLGDTQPLERRGPGSKWGVLSVRDQDGLLEVFPWVEESHRRITDATEKNESSAWRAVPDEAVEEEVEV